jgi:hypothetical protein
MMAGAPPALIDELLPRFDEFERHEILVAAPPATVYAALRRTDLFSSRIIRGLLLLRAAPGALRRGRRPRRPGAVTLERMLERGFVLLGERPDRELVLGVVGRFWRLASEPLTLDAAGFRAFDRPATPRPCGISGWSPSQMGRRGCRRRPVSAVSMLRAAGGSGSTGGSSVRSAA